MPLKLPTYTIFFSFSLFQGAEISGSEEESDGSVGEEAEGDDDDDASVKKKAKGKRGNTRKASPPPSKRLKTAVETDEIPTWKKELVEAKKAEDEKAKTDALWAGTALYYRPILFCYFWSIDVHF